MPEAAVYVMEKMAHGYRRMGRDSGAGFYDYADDGSATLWSGLKAFERRNVNVPEEDVRDRLLFIQSLEAVRCLEEHIVESAADADAGSIGLCGFPAASGGAVQYVRQVGTAKFVARARELAARYGDRFLPPARLIEEAKREQPLQDQDPQQTTSG